MQSIRALLEGIIDYAGLFPPAKLAMAEAVRSYADHLGDRQVWMLGRFVVPAARLDEFAEAAREWLPGPGAPPWQLSALAGEDPAAAVEQIVGHRARPAGNGATIASLEIRAAVPDEIRRGLAVVPDDVETFFELPAAADLAPLIDALSGTAGRAKIRTGGVTEAAFPTPEQLAGFLVTCARAGVPFKATAGLHHPLRGVYRLTYDEDAPSGAMFGFLNVFIAGAFAAAGLLAEGDLVELLCEGDVGRFEFDDDGLSWRGERLGLADLRDVRRSFALSFGSCSFGEPVEDLRSLHLLPQ